MHLPKDYSSHDALKILRDDFDFAHALMKYAVRKDIGSFTFAGLRVPAILEDPQSRRLKVLSPGSSLEVVIFQDHLHDRITMLARNNRMLREIWAFNERSRAFREFELLNADMAADTLDRTAELVSALRTCAQRQVVSALRKNVEARLGWIDIFLAKLPIP